MNTLKLITLFSLLLIQNILKAQYSDFDLSKYKLPDIKTNWLDARFNLNNSHSLDRETYTNDSPYRYLRDNFNSSLNLDYYHFRNTENYQGQIDGFGSIHPNFDRYGYSYSTEKSRSISGEFGFESTNRFYNSNLNFIEINPSVEIYSGSSYNNKHFNNPDSTSDYDFTTKSYSVSLPVSIGHGRIEPVEDLRLAIYIIEELKKEGRIRNAPAENVLIEMARVISRIKRERFFDSRIKKIHELQVIDSFLVANNIVSTNDIKYFAIVNDQWDYASGPSRMSGIRLNAGIDNEIVFNRTHNKARINDEITEDGRGKTNTYNIFGFVKADFAKPLNLYWQTSAMIKASYGPSFIKYPLDGTSSRINLFNAGFSYRIQYLPNSRTSFSLSFWSAYENSLKQNITNSDTERVRRKEERINVGAGLNVYYYVSPQLRVQLVSELTNNHVYTNTDFYYYNGWTKENLFQNSINLSLVYSFF